MVSETLFLPFFDNLKGVTFKSVIFVPIRKFEQLSNSPRKVSKSIIKISGWRTCHPSPLPGGDATLTVYFKVIITDRMILFVDDF